MGLTSIDYLTHKPENTHSSHNHMGLFFKTDHVIGHKTKQKHFKSIEKL